jgi:uncharacterized membrane protein YdjX (TVP38/TMEM64 family)
MTWQRLKLILVSVRELAVLLAVLVLLTLAFQAVGLEKIQSWVQQTGVWGMVIFVLAHTLTIMIAPLEGSVLMLSAGQLFGNFWLAVGLVIVAGWLGATINFFLARELGQRSLRRLLGKRIWEQIQKYSRRLESNSWLLLPLMLTGMFDILGYAAGLSSLKYRTFALMVALSSLISVPVYVGLGQQAAVNQGLLLTVVVLLVVVLLSFFGLRAFIGKKREKGNHS